MYIRIPAQRLEYPTIVAGPTVPNGRFRESLHYVVSTRVGFRWMR